MPKFRDPATGRIEVFDHEPSPQELEARFGAAAPAQGQAEPPGHSIGRTLATDVAAPMAGFVAGGALGGKPGAVVGATGGQALGDLYNTVADHGANPFHASLNPFEGMKTDTSQLGPNAPPSMMDELKRLGMAAASATGGAYLLGPATRALPGPVAVKTPLINAIGGALAGNQVGHPYIGGAIGGALSGYNALSGMLKGAGNLAETLTTPRFEPPPSAASPEMPFAGRVTADGRVPRVVTPQGQGPSASTPPPPGPSGPSLASRAWGGIKSGASAAVDGLSQLAGKFGVEPEAPPTAPGPPRSTEVPYKFNGSIPDYSQANASSVPREAPSNLTQTHSTDPQVDWQELKGHNPRTRSAPGGYNWAVDEQNLRTNPQTGQNFAGDSAAGPLSGLKSAVEPTSPPIGTHDAGLQRWLESGGTPESYAAAQGRLQPPQVSQSHPFGPNTVGAAQAPQWLPKTVDEAKGLSLPEQDAWEGFKRSNPGTTDSMLNSWYTSNQLGADPNAHLDVQGKIDKLMDLLKVKNP